LELEQGQNVAAFLDAAADLLITHRTLERDFLSPSGLDRRDHELRGRFLRTAAPSAANASLTAPAPG